MLLELNSENATWVEAKVAGVVDPEVYGVAVEAKKLPKYIFLFSLRALFTDNFMWLHPRISWHVMVHVASSTYFMACYGK